MQGRLESIQYWDAPDTDLFTVKGISLVLGINRNAVAQIPVQRIMIDKRGYYRKGDVRAWVEMDGKQPDSLLLKLRDEQTRAEEKIRTQRSRRYVSGQQNKDEAKQAREKTKENRHKEPDKDQDWMLEMFPFLVGATGKERDKS